MKASATVPRLPNWRISVEDGRRARSAGGIKRSRHATVLLPDTPDHHLGNTKEVADLLADSINRLRRGQLDPRVANAVGYLSTVLLRALEQGPLEERMAQLEALFRPAGTSKSAFPTK